LISGRDLPRKPKVLNSNCSTNQKWKNGLLTWYDFVYICLIQLYRDDKYIEMYMIR
jgi:hypothetical protein